MEESKIEENTFLIGPFDCPLVTISKLNATLRRKENMDYERAQSRLFVRISEIFQNIRHVIDSEDGT